MDKDLTQAEVLKRRMEHETKMLKKEETETGAKQAAKLVDLYADLPNTVTDPQSKVINILTPDVKNVIVGYAFLGLIEWAAEATGGRFTAEQIKKATLERALRNVEKDGLFDPSVGNDTEHVPQKTSFLV
jgi:hypothetical protein